MIQLLNNNCPTVTTLSFADDLKLQSSDAKSLQHALDLVEQWCNTWQQKIQPDKSVIISYTRGRTTQSTPTTYQINGSNIIKSNVFKDLGIFFEEDLKWNSHVAHIKHKAARISYLILKSFQSQNLFLYLLLYKAYIRPITEFNTSIWNPNNHKNIRDIENVQKKFTRQVFQRLNLKYNSYFDRLQTLKIKTLEYRRASQDLINLYKMLNNIIDIDTNTLFRRSDFYNTHNLRRHNQCLKPIYNAKTNIRKNFFAERVIKAWNKLPDRVIQSRSVQEFKQRLDQVDLNQIFTFVFKPPV